MDDTLYFASQDEFKQWLEQNHQSASELWVGYFKKSTGRATLTWSDSVDAALCFGWIDGVRNTVDAERYKIRFTPRKTGSVWSAVNVKKVNALIKSGEMRPEGLELFHARKDAEGYSAESMKLELTKEYEEHLKANKKAWEFFEALAPSYRRQSVYWVMSAKREVTQLKRLEKLILSFEAGERVAGLG
ncbi:YdeI/OmpD-associated family protein [bacterium]|nr:YdeI/OmpD-associated family protein [bacterium]